MGVTVVNGALLSLHDPRAKRAAKRLIWISLILAFFCVINTVVKLVTFGDLGAFFGNASMIGALLAELAIALSIPACGYFGAKQSNSGLLWTACVCSSICAFFFALSLAAILALLAGVTNFANSVPGVSSNVNSGGVVWAILYLGFGFVAFSLGAFYSSVVARSVSVRVVVATPPVPTAEVALQKA